MSVIALTQELQIRFDIRRRIGALLYHGRSASNKTPEAVANKFQISVEDLLAWESGLVPTPPAQIFIGLIRFYGQESLGEAADLIFQLHDEQTQRIVAEQVSVNLSAPLNKPTTAFRTTA